MRDSARLDAVFATLLPGGAPYPSAAGLGLGARAADYPHFSEAIDGALKALPADFAAADHEAREATLHQLESAQPALFSALVTAAYSLYYSDPVVLQVIADTANYTPRSPQPEGYRLDPFDPAVVARPAAHEPSWRRTDGFQTGDPS